MLRFVNQIFISAMMRFSSNVLNVNSLESLSMNNQECITNVNSNEPSFYPYSVKINKCSGICNNINDPFAKLCVPDVAKNINLEVFTLMSRTNTTRHINLHEICRCKCRLEASVCNNKQRWNEDKYRCECKELLDKGVCDKGFIWNLSNYECECEECTENINEVTMTRITLTEYKNECKPYCTLYIVLFSIIFTINIGIGAYFFYYKYIDPSKKW